MSLLCPGEARAASVVSWRSACSTSSGFLRPADTRRTDRHPTPWCQLTGYCCRCSPLWRRPLHPPDSDVPTVNHPTQSHSRDVTVKWWCGSSGSAAETIAPLWPWKRAVMVRRKQKCIRSFWFGIWGMGGRRR